MQYSTKFFFEENIFYIFKNVYAPAEDSIFFAENLSITKGDFVLDMGVGCGILSVLAAKRGAKVVAVDINPYAVKCAYKNACINQVNDRILFLQGDLFSSLNTLVSFDISCVERAWAGGVNGRQIIDHFIDGVPLYLKEDGIIYLLQSTLCDVNASIRKFQEKELETCINATLKLPFFESLFLLKAFNKF